MGLLDRIHNRRPAAEQRRPSSVGLPARGRSTPDAIALGGRHDLEVVGESHYQDSLWQVVGRRTTERVRVEIKAVLLAETDNPYDANAVSIWINGLKVGYLSRDDAAAYRPGLLALELRHGVPIALAGVIVGGGIRLDGPGMLGVWLSHDPTDFGLVPIVPPPVPALAGAMRTGLTEALLTDAADDSYDLSWLHRLPVDAIAAIRQLRTLLEHDPDPIDRHFMFCELEDQLYRSRDAFASALTEYDQVCARHDAEMDGIRHALLAKFGAVPLLDTYRQMTIRQQKIKDWTRAIWWAQRGLTLYADRASRPEFVDDLRKRLASYQAKLAADSARSVRAPTATPARQSAPSNVIEVLVCASCCTSFERAVVSGRKPKSCPACR